MLTHECSKLKFERDRCILSVQIPDKAAMKKSLISLFTLLILAAGFCFAGDLDDDLSIRLEMKQVENLTTTSLSYVFYLNIKNVSSKSYFLTRYRYRFVVDEREYLQINTASSDGLEIIPSETTMVAIPLKITYEHLFQAIEGISEMDSVPCYLMGELFFSEGKKERGSLPIAFNGEFPIFRAPEIEIVSLNANTISIAGADLGFNFKLNNGNGFILRVHEIKYVLKLGGFPVDEGQIEGDKNIEIKGEKAFAIHLLLNFFDVGKELYAVLQQSDVEAAFSGEIGILTNWGRLQIPFSINKKLLLNHL
jgi:LEA14-like dessication related protein